MPFPAASIEDYARMVGFHPNGRLYEPEEWPLARAVTHGECVSDEEIDVIGADRKCAMLSVSASPVRDRQGRTIAGVAVFHDVTARRNAEWERERLLAENRLARQRLEQERSRRKERRQQLFEQLKEIGQLAPGTEVLMNR
jgi:hypothetical protein